MDRSEKRLRGMLAKARGGHKRVLEARLAKVTRTEEVAPAAPKRKKRAKKATKKD